MVCDPDIIRLTREGETSLMKQFNTTAVCTPEKHYMVDLSERVQEIKKLVDEGKYLTINRARQYGKTTTLTALKPIEGLLASRSGLNMNEDSLDEIIDKIAELALK